MTLDHVQRHEAGHAVLAAVLGAEFSHVSAAPDGNGGHVRFDGQTAASDAGDWCLIALAGVGAESAAGFSVGEPSHDDDIGQALAAMGDLGIADPLPLLPAVVGAVADVFRLPTMTRLVGDVADDLARNNGWLPAAAVRGRVWSVPADELASVRRRLRRIISGRLVKDLTKGDWGHGR